jgi:hypothetical protein
VPRNAVVSVGCLWGRPGSRTCGIFVGHAEGLRWPTWLVLTDLGPRLPGAGSRLSPALLGAAALPGLSSSLICWGRVIPGHAGGAARPGPVPAWSRLVSGVGHDAVVGAVGAGAAGAGAVAAEHLGGGPAVEFHQVSFGAAAVQPGVAEVVPEPVRVQAESALPAAAGDHLVDAGGGRRLPVAGSEQQLGRQACPCRERERWYRSRFTAAWWPIRSLPPLPQTVISLCHRSMSLHRRPASSDSRMPVAVNTAMIAVSRRCAFPASAHPPGVYRIMPLSGCAQSRRAELCERCPGANLVHSRRASPV